MAQDGFVLITGGNSGIGFECARVLAASGERVAIASRNREISERAAREIGKDCVALRLDLASFAGIREFAKELQARDLPVRALVCNAGLQFSKGPVPSADGHESTFAVNHLGHFLLVNLLLRRLARGPARIVVVASGVHDPALTTGMPNPNVTSMDALSATGGAKLDSFDGRLAYVNSKLCNLWFTYELIRRLEAASLSSDPASPLSVNAFEPGLVPSTGLARDYPPALRWIWERVGPTFGRVASRLTPTINTVEQAGAALAGVVTDPALERSSGSYFPSHTRFARAPSSPESHDEDRARELWERSVAWTGLTAEESPLVRGDP